MDEAEGVPFLLRRVVARFARRARAALLDARGCSLSAHDGIELMALIEKLCGDAEPPVGCREELRRLYREISRTLYSAREDDETAPQLRLALAGLDEALRLMLEPSEGELAAIRELFRPADPKF